MTIAQFHTVRENSGLLNFFFDDNQQELNHLLDITDSKNHKV
jgi:hypothetical protein